MTLEDFKSFLYTCIDAVSKAKNMKFGPIVFEQTSEQNLKAVFSYYPNQGYENRTFEINFYIPEDS